MESIEQAANIFRHLWVRRNVFVFQKKLVSPTHMLGAASLEYEDFSAVNKRDQGDHGTENLPRQSSCWKAPWGNIVKINLDATVCEK